LPKIAERTERRRTSLDRELRRELRATRRAELDDRRLGRLLPVAAWPVAVTGATLFLASYVGAVTGTQVLPFDPHHTLGQLGGGVLAATGLAAATRQR
jgi:hypothetical protein